MDQLAVFISLPLWQLFIFFGWVVLVRINLASVFSPLFLFSIFLWQDCLSSPLPYQTSLTSLCKREVCVAPTCNCMSCLYFYFKSVLLFSLRDHHLHCMRVVVVVVSTLSHLWDWRMYLAFLILTSKMKHPLWSHLKPN